jgi:type III secretion protein J
LRRVLHVVVLACALLLTSLGTVACAGQNVIVHGMDEYEANEILVVLDSKGITGTKVIEAGRKVTYAVAVPGNQASDALRLLVANKLPRARPNTLDLVYPQGGGGLIPTKSEEKAKFLMAMHGEIERKLKQLPGIVQAHVSIVQPDKDIVRDLDTPAPPSTASVAMVFNPIDERGTASVTIDDVRALVAASVEDLKPQNVQVVMKKNAPTWIIDPTGDVAGAAPVTTEPVLGVRVADKKSAQRIQLVLAILGAAAILGLLLGVFAIVRMYVLRGQVVKAQAALQSMTKARREGTNVG